MRLYTSILAMLLLCGIGCSEKKKMEKKHHLFVGTYTDGESKGIYKLTFNASTGELSNKTLAAELDNPSFLKISDDRKNLYAVHEVADFDSLGGGVSAFLVKDGILEFQNSRGTSGKHPCHVSLSDNGFLAAANYSGGNFSVFKLNDDGSLPEHSQVIDHKILDTSKVAHAHMAQFEDNNLFVADLGLDAVKRYEWNGEMFGPAKQSSLNMPQGAGPRHFTFGKNGILYVINELNSTITVFEKKENGDYEEIQTVETLASDFEGKSYCADIHLSADGKFLYGSNRGENTIVIFSVDENSGLLNVVGRTSVHGDWPRNFSLDPTGKFLLVANQRSHNITVYSRNQEQGTLQFLNEFKMPSPVCLEFLN